MKEIMPIMDEEEFAEYLNRAEEALVKYNVTTLEGGMALLVSHMKCSGRVFTGEQIEEVIELAYR